MDYTVTYLPNGFVLFSSRCSACLAVSQPSFLSRTEETNRSTSTVAHIGQAIYYRTWWMLPTAAMAAIGEVIGWIGRLWSSKNIPLLTPFLIQ